MTLGLTTTKCHEEQINHYRQQTCVVAIIIVLMTDLRVPYLRFHFHLQRVHGIHNAAGTDSNHEVLPQEEVSDDAVIME